MFIPFMTRIVVDTSGEEIRGMTTVLEKNDIRYKICLKRTRVSIGSALDAVSYTRSNIAMYMGAAAPPVVYKVYVKRKDFDHDYDLVHCL
jgi:hypothetical protein